MTDYEHDLWLWKNDQSKYGDFSEAPNRNDYDELGYKKNSVVYEKGLILDPFLIKNYGKEYAINNKLGTYNEKQFS